MNSIFQFEKCFLEAVETLRASHHPQCDEQTHSLQGPNGETLRTHSVFIPGRRDLLVVSVSGTHGPEALIGSQIQTEYLKELKSSPLKNSPSVLLIHNLNCFGSAWQRRANADNIDLNRNGWTAPPQNIDFEKFQDWLKSKNSWSYWIKFLALLTLAPRWGVARVVGAVACGQNQDSENLFYSGKARSRELQFLIAQVKKQGHFPRLVVLDVHTGLGRYGQESLICDVSLSSPLEQQLQNQLNWPLVFANQASDIYSVTGSQSQLFQSEFQDRSVVHVTQEFGTYPFWKILRALVRENQQWFAGHRSSLDRGAELQKHFYIEDEIWKSRLTKLGAQRLRELAKLS